MRYQPQLDGLRALAVLAVLQHHIGIPRLTGGFIGVSMFFVLSGFLITGLLVEELERTGTLNLRHFYLRRLLRLYPALVAAVALALVLAETTHSFEAQTERAAPLALAYLVDIDAWRAGSTGLLSHTWSLAIEAQFYLVWPVIVWFAWRRSASLAAALAGAAVCLALAVINTALIGHPRYPGRNITYYFPLLSAIPLLFGAALAIVVRSRHPPDWLRSPTIAWVAGIVLWAALAEARPDGTLMSDIGFPMIFLAAVTLLGFSHMRPTSGLSVSLAQPILVWIGIRSYGIYLYHYPWALAFRTTGPLWLRALEVTACTFVTATVSWRYLERPILRRARGLRGRESASDPAAVHVPKPRVS